MTGMADNGLPAASPELSKIDVTSVGTLSSFLFLSYMQSIALGSDAVQPFQGQKCLIKSSLTALLDIAEASKTLYIESPANLVSHAR